MSTKGSAEKDTSGVGGKVVVGALLVGAAVGSAAAYLADPKHRDEAMEKGEKLKDKVQDKAAAIGDAAKDMTHKAQKMGGKAVDAAKDFGKNVKESVTHVKDEVKKEGKHLGHEAKGAVSKVK